MRSKKLVVGGVGVAAALALGVLAVPAGAGTYPATPNDPLFPDQWGPQRIEAPQAWQQPQATGLDVKLAVIDSGVDLQHEDLQCPGKLQVPPDADLVDNPPDGPDDDNGHGTHVAGIAAACTNNGVGTVGVAPDATILPYQVINEAGTGTFEDLATAIGYATRDGAHVINISLGPEPGLVSYLPLFSDVDLAIEEAQAQGVVVVAAAGNDSMPLCEYPALVEDVICVGATDRRDLKSWYSVFPNKLDDEDVVGPGVVAPGGSLTTGLLFCEDHAESILSLYPPELDTICDELKGYEDLNGTSMASPHVAGVAALVYDRLGAVRSPDNMQTVIDTIISTTDDLGLPGYDPAFGYGRVNALNAVSAAPLVAHPQQTGGGASSPPPSETAPPTSPPPSSPPPSSPPASSSPSESASPSPGSSATPTPEESASTSPPPSSAPQNQPPSGTVSSTLSSERRRVTHLDPVMLSGVLTTTGDCSYPGRVAILRRSFDGSDGDGFVEIGGAPVTIDGAWSFEALGDESATYIALPDSDGGCVGERSSSVSVLVRALIEANLARRCDAPQAITGMVIPKHPRTRVLLQKKRPGRWARVDSDRLDERSRFRLVAPRCAGRYRIVWPKQDASHTRAVYRFSF